MTEYLSGSWQSDPAGRIRNLSLAPSQKNALVGLFEAVMNSIHAIEERFGKDNISNGVVRIEVIRDKGEAIGFRVSDNGIGFNEENIDSFRRMDSQAKAKIGGKGVGRLVWLKTLDSVNIESTYQNEKNINSIIFTFCIDHPTKHFRSIESENKSSGTLVNLFPYRSEYAVHIPKKLNTISNRILAHFISYFVNISHP